MKPDPLASRGCRCCGSNCWKKSSSPGGALRGRGVRFSVVFLETSRSAWIETTAGVTCSAIDTNALLASAIDLTSWTDGLAAFTAGRDCAYPKCVRSKPDAKTIPVANAIATAAPKRARANVRDDIGLWSLQVVFTGTTAE